MSDLDAGFLEVLASCEAAEGEVDYTDDGWMPKDGEYTVLLEKFTFGTTDKDGITNARAKAIFRIIGTEEFDGRSFGEFFWMPGQAKTTSMGQANLLRLGTCLCGRDLSVSETREAAQHIADAAAFKDGTILNVRVFTTTSKKDGKTYTNTRFLGLVDDAGTDAAVETEEATA
ncbi:hypothetical protein LCGC14_0330250 [marine sediment metagenome]|uniref:Uncharacterized protein n=1 Tax=marine sediment metagenome TaxID=412755 RepID=A0A0F9TZK0_9ZZZZ